MEISQTLANVLAAATAAHLIHCLMEPMLMRVKLKRLVAYMDGKKWKEPPFKIDTRPKAITVGYVTVAVFFGLSYLVVSAINPEPRTAIILAIASMLFIELVNTVVIDKYHAEIEVVTKRFKK